MIVSRSYSPEGEATWDRVFGVRGKETLSTCCRAVVFGSENFWTCSECGKYCEVESQN